MKNHKKILLVVIAAFAVVSMYIYLSLRPAPVNGSEADRCYVPGIHAGAPAGCPQ